MECYAVDFGATSCTVTGLVNGVRNAFTVKVAYGGRAHSSLGPGIFTFIEYFHPQSPTAPCCGFLLARLMWW